MTRVHLATLGCKVNAYDTATIAERLRAAGCEIVPAGAPADVVVVNSCTVTDAADAESRRLARRARRENPAARVILTGCYAQTKPVEAAGEPAVDHVIGLNRLDALVTAVTARGDDEGYIAGTFHLYRVPAPGPVAAFTPVPTPTLRVEGSLRLLAATRGRP